MTQATAALCAGPGKPFEIAEITLDADQALSIARRIRSGSVAQNGMGPQGGMPFGGFKQSGIGREGSPEVFEAYTELQTIYLMQPQAAAA